MMKNKKSNNGFTLPTSKKDFCVRDVDNGGESKSPVIPPKTLDNNVCIDYLKVRFDGCFDKNDLKYKMLLTILGVKPDEFDGHIPVSGYKFTVVYDVNVFISWGGKYTALDDGTETTMLELKGQACREFEQRQGNWFNLLKYIADVGGVCKRIDIPLDDFNQFIKMPTILDKIYKGLYVTGFRAKPQIISSNGVTITFGAGSGSKKQLCIYDKKAEREFRNYNVMCDSWIRFESRFMDENAQPVMLDVMKSMKDGSFGDYVKRVLRGLLDLKEKNSDDFNHQGRNKTFIGWEKLTGDEDKIVVCRQSKIETIARKKMKWAYRSTFGVRIEEELCLLGTGELDNFEGKCFFDHFGDVNNRMVSRVNYFREEYGFEKITLGEARKYLWDKYSDFADGNKFVNGILVNYPKQNSSNYGFETLTGKILGVDKNENK